MGEASMTRLSLEVSLQVKSQQRKSVKTYSRNLSGGCGCDVQ